MKVLVLLMILSIAVPALAQEGLYAPAVPEDAALVRVINATPEAVTIDVGPLRYADVSPSSATAYRPLLADVLVVSHDGAREVITPRERTFLSVVLVPGGLYVMEDERHTDPARAQLVLYNLTGSAVSFRAVEPAATIIPEVAAGESDARAVNAISVTIGAFLDDEPLVTAQVELERGESYALVVIGPTVTDDPAGFLVQASVSSE